MSSLDSLVYSLERDYGRKKAYQDRLQSLLKEKEECEKLFQNGLEAQKLLGSVADERSNRVLNFVTNAINKTLSEVFPTSTRRIHLEHTLHADKYPHINVVLEVENGKRRDLAIQSGSGLGEIVSFLYRLCLIEVRGGRKFVFADELLRGVHKDAMAVVLEIIKIFAEGGFQIIFVEYGFPDDFGRTYLIEKEGAEAHISLYKGGDSSEFEEASAQDSVEEEGTAIEETV